MKTKFSFRQIGASFHTRSFRVGGYSVAATAIVLAIAVAVNLLISALPSTMTQLDATSNQIFTISDQTEKLVSSLSNDVTVYWVVRDGYEDSVIGNLLDNYQSLSKHLKVVKRDPDVYPAFVQLYTDDVTDNSLIVESGSRSRYIDYYDIFVIDYYSYYYYGTQDWSFYGESELTSAIDYCINEELPMIYTLSGHGESTIPSDYLTAMEYENMETSELTLLNIDQIPEDADAIMIYAPQSDISEEEKTMLEAYLASGGNLIAITDPPQDSAMANLEALMETYGLIAAEGIVVEGSRSNYAWSTPYCLLPELASHDITDPLSENGYYVLLPIAQGIQISDILPENVTVTELLTTSDSAFSKVAGYQLTTYEAEDGDIPGPFALAVLASVSGDDGSTGHVIWVSSTALLNTQYNTQVSGGNQDFFLNMLSYLCEPESSSLSIHAKSLSVEYLTMDTGTASSLTLLVIGIIPLGYLAIGIIIWFRRKRR